MTTSNETVYDSDKKLHFNSIIIKVEKIWIYTLLFIDNYEFQFQFIQIRLIKHFVSTVRKDAIFTDKTNIKCYIIIALQFVIFTYFSDFIINSLMKKHHTNYIVNMILFEFTKKNSNYYFLLVLVII